MAFLNNSGVERLWQHIVAKLSTKVNTDDCGDIISHDASEFAETEHTHEISSLSQTSGYVVFDCGTSDVNV